MNKQHRVLIVEDEAPLADVIQRTLQMAGFETETAPDVSIAADLLKSFSPSVLTLDLHLQGMSGMELLKVIRSNESFNHVRILVVSAMAETLLQEAIDSGADAVLPKPFRNAVLVDRIVSLTRAAEKNAEESVRKTA
jgi:DNA-binding response OmpR family regulator